MDSFWDRSVSLLTSSRRWPSCARRSLISPRLYFRQMHLWGQITKWRFWRISDKVICALKRGRKRCRSRSALGVSVRHTGRFFRSLPCCTCSIIKCECLQFLSSASYVTIYAPIEFQLDHTASPFFGGPSPTRLTEPVSPAVARAAISPLSGVQRKHLHALGSLCSDDSRCLHAYIA